MTKKCICPIAKMVGTLGDKWSLIILRDILFSKKKHYGEFLDSPEKISTNILANRLKMLEKEKLLSSSIDQQNRRLKYTYQPKRHAILNLF